MLYLQLLKATTACKAALLNICPCCTALHGPPIGNTVPPEVTDDDIASYFWVGTPDVM